MRKFIKSAILLIALLLFANFSFHIAKHIQQKGKIENKVSTSVRSSKQQSKESKQDETSRSSHTSSSQGEAPTSDDSDAPIAQPLPFLKKKQLVLKDVDKLGRAVDAHIQLNENDLPSETREPYLSYDPVGWHNYNFYYENSEGKVKKAWLMNRGHLVGFLFSGLNDEPKNLVPETAFLNQGDYASMDQGNENAMLFYETGLLNWLKNHPDAYLDYQVTPIYTGDELVPRSIRLCYCGYDKSGKIQHITLGSSIEDEKENGMTVVYLENTSPNATIDYLTGVAKNTISPPAASQTSETKDERFTFAGVSFSSKENETFNIEVVKTLGDKIGFAKGDTTVYVSGRGKSKVYWFDKEDFPSGTNLSNVIEMTLKEAVGKGKTLSNIQE